MTSIAFTGFWSLIVYLYFPSLVSINQTCHQGHPEIPEHVAQSQSVLIGAPGHQWPLTNILIPLPEHHPEEDFAELPGSHQTESTPSRGNNPEEPVDEGLGDEPLERQTDSDNENAGNNLATTISALARNVRTQGDGSRAKVREPNPFDGTDPTKL